MAKKKVHASRKAAGRTSAKKHAKPGAKKRAAAKAQARGKPAASAIGKRAIVENVRWVHATMDKLIDTYPADKALYQVAGTDNHLMWTIGHLATSYSWFASLLDGRSAALPAEYNALFGYQSKPTGNAAVYPSLEEVKSQYRVAYARFSEAMESLSAEDLARPPATESHGFAATRLDVLIRTAWHDGWHSGQLSSLRRALGLPPMM